MSRFSSQYLETRLDIFASRLIPYPRLVAMIEQPLEQIMGEIADFGEGRGQIDLSSPNRIESQLMQRALEDIRILIRPFSGNERRFFFFAMRWFELANLKVLIRGKFSGAAGRDIERQLVDLGGFTDQPLTRLIETDDPYEMLRLLETTAYAGIVRQARRVYEEQGHDLFLLDATIDRVFFIDLIQRAQFLQEQDAEFVGRVMNEVLDRFNLLWLLRYRFAYGLSPAKSFYLLTATGRRLHSVELMRLARLESIEEVVAALPKPYRQRLEGLRVIADMETVLEYHSLSVAADLLRSKSNLLARGLAYILLREAEVRFLQALIKGKLLEFDPALIRQAVGVQA